MKLIRDQRRTQTTNDTEAGTALVLFAVLVFAISVVSVPMMLDRGTDGVVAVLTSARAFGANLPAMAVWGVAIVVVIAAGFALLFVGLVVAAPVIGHATWHAYRALVE